jgi:acetyl esterase/lipase
VTPDSSDVGVGQSRQLAVTLTDEAGNTLTGRTVTWSSPDTTIVAVTSSGLARGHNSGTVTITATSEGKQGTARVRVPPSDSVTLASLTNVTYCTGRLSSGAVKSLQMDVLYPSRAVPAPLPVAIWVHGGAWAGDNISGPLYPAIRDELLKRGYAVVPIHYRTSGSGTGYGPKPWPAPLEDAKCAVRHLRANAATYHIDPDRIGAWGHSAGGHIVAALATVPEGTFEGTGGSAGVSSRVQAVAALAPATDITRPGEIPGVDAATMQAEFPALPDSTATSIIEASPVHWASAGDTPMLLVHGDADAVIDDVQSIRLDSALTAAGVPSTFVIAHGADHSFTITSSMPTPSQIVQRVADFLDSLLK